MPGTKKHPEIQVWIRSEKLLAFLSRFTVLGLISYISIWYSFWIFSIKESSGSLSIVQLSRFFFAVCLLLSATAILEYHQYFHLSTVFSNFFIFLHFYTLWRIKLLKFIINILHKICIHLQFFRFTNLKIIQISFMLLKKFRYFFIWPLEDNHIIALILKNFQL